MNVTPDLDQRFREAALREGLIDVRYDIVESPVGDLFVAATDRGLARISYRLEGMEETLARTFGSRVLRSPLDEVRRELDEYFAGERKSFDLPLDLRVAPFPAGVLAELARVPYGQTETYGALAAKAGRPTRGASRRHGDEPQSDPDRAAVPPHRRCERFADGLRGWARREVAAAAARRCNARVEWLSASLSSEVGSPESSRCAGSAAPTST